VEVPAASWSLVSSQLPLEAAAHLSSSLQVPYWWPAVDGGGGRNGRGRRRFLLWVMYQSETSWNLVPPRVCLWGFYVLSAPLKKSIPQTSVLKDINLPSKCSRLRWMLLALKRSIAFCLLACAPFFLVDCGVDKQAPPPLSSCGVQAALFLCRKFCLADPAASGLSFCAVPIDMACLI